MKYLLTIRSKESENEKYEFVLSIRPSIHSEASGKTIKDIVIKNYTGGKGFDSLIRAASKINDSARKLAKIAEGTAVEEEFGAAHLEIANSIDGPVSVLKRSLQTFKKIDEDARYKAEISEVSEEDIAAHQSR